MSETKQQSKEIDGETIEQIKQDLLSQKARILKELENISGVEEGTSGEHGMAFPDFGDKADDNAQEISEYTTNLATEKVLENTLKDIENALKNIENGTYGICKYCGKEIGKKRMMARPVASACIECKTKLQSGA